MKFTTEVDLSMPPEAALLLDAKGWRPEVLGFFADGVALVRFQISALVSPADPEEVARTFRIATDIHQIHPVLDVESWEVE